MSLGQRVWRHPITRIIAFLLLFIAGMAIIGIPLSGAFAGARRFSTPAIFVGALIEAIAALVAFFVMVLLADRRSLASAGITVRGMTTETVAGYLIGMAIFSVVIAIMAVAGVYHVLGRNAAFHPLVPLTLFLVVAVAEEIVFRGYIFQTLERRWGSGIALVCTSVLFGFAHMVNPGPHATLWQHIAGPAFICLEAGLPLAAGYMATRRLWLSIGLHWAWNFFEGPIYGADVSGIQVSTLYHARFTGPFILTGGSFGPEASIIALVVGTFAGLLLLRVAIRAGHWKTGAQLVAPASVYADINSSPPEPKEDQGNGPVR